MPAADVSIAPCRQRAEDARPAAAPDWRRIAQALLLVVATVVCYLPSLGGGLLWDDRELVFENPLMKSAAGLWQIWFSTVPLDYYPIDNTSLWLGWHLWGADPLGYRVVNLAWHIGSAFLLWRLLAVWRVRGAWYAALLFALHPLNVASVAWIAERKNVLSMFFYLATLLCWAHAEQAPAASRRRTFYLGALAAFALALGSKSSVVMLPCVLLLIAWWRRGQIRWPDVRRTLPFFGLSLAAGMVSLWFQRRMLLPREVAAALPPAARAVLLGKSIWFYLGKALFPHPLVMIYPRWQLLPIRAVDFVPLGLLVLLCAGVGWLGLRRGWRGPAAALAFFCLNLLPVAGVFHMTFYTLSYVSDHLAYLALLSMCVLCAAGLAAAGERPAGRLVSAVASVAIIGVCGLLTWQRAGDFGSARRLWQNTLILNPGCAGAQNNCGLALEDAGQMQAAESCFRNALRLDPVMDPALVNLAVILRKERRWPEAAQAYRQTLARHGDPENYNNYGVVLLYLGDSADAAAQFRNALRLDPMLFSAHYNLYKLALKAGDQAAMANELRVCRRLDPGNAALRL
jgi:tetratricopeptide (TPR) repeat protein